MKPVDKDLIIKGENIYLRPITGEDTEQVLRWRNAPDVVENFLYRKKITVEEHQNWLKNKVFTGAVHQFVICMGIVFGCGWYAQQRRRDGSWKFNT